MMRIGKRGLTLFAAGWLMVGIANAQEGAPDAAAVFRAGVPEEPALSRLVIKTEFIEIDAKAYAAWMADPQNSRQDPKLHAHVQQLLKDGKARLRDLNVVATRSGERGKTASYDFLIHPSQFAPPIAAENGSATTPVVIAATECRNLGFTTECDAVLSQDGKTVDINLSPEIVTEDGETRHGAGEAEIGYPRFRYLKTTTQITAPTGEPALVGVLSEEKSESFASPATVLVFVTADAHAPPQNHE